MFLYWYITPKDTEKIDKHYKGMWQKCRDRWCLLPICSGPVGRLANPRRKYAEIQKILNIKFAMKPEAMLL